MTHLADTNAWIAYMRRKDPAFLQKANQYSHSDLALCSVVVGELLFGAHHASPAYRPINLAMVAQIRQDYVSLPFDDRAAEEYGKIRHYLAALGTPIGPNDLMIASIALANNLILVTHNTTEFSRVPDLKIEDWQTP